MSVESHIPKSNQFIGAQLIVSGLFSFKSQQHFSH